MGNAKLQIEVNNHHYENGMVYAAIGLRGGFITKDYILDGQDIFHGNYAFYNVLFNYYRMVNIETGLHFDVQRASAIISFATSFIVFPSADAPIFALASFIIAPISFIVVAPISAIIFSNSTLISSLLNCFGKYSVRISISFFTFNVSTSSV